VIRFMGKPGSVLDIIVIDTLKHFDSLIQYIYDKPGWDSRRYSAILDDATKAVLWDSVYCYDVLSMQPDEIVNWKSRGAPGYEKIRIPFYGRLDEYGVIGLAEENPDSFGQEFLGVPIQYDQMPLRKDLWQYFDMSPALALGQKVRVGALDLAMGKKSGDFQAIAVVGSTGNDYYLIDASLTKYALVNSKTGEGEQALARLCMLYIMTYNLQAFIIEDNGAQGLFINALVKQIRDEEKKTGQIAHCRIMPRTSKGDKDERIKGTLGLIMQRGSFFVRRDYGKCYPDFMRQFEYYPKGGHDDAPDVTNMAITAIGKSRAQSI